MKKISLSLLAALSIGSTALSADSYGFYIGGGYAYTTVELSLSTEWFDLPSFDASTDSILLLAGYDFNDFIGVEGRYYWNVTSGIAYSNDLYGLLDDYKAESFAFYLKPQYSFDALSLYALLGFTMNDYTALAQSKNDTLFSWGGGARFRFTESFSAFVDYTDLGTSDMILSTGLSSWNLGLTYKF